jgi:glycosyltransferase involved in cell wall biosynthesis
VGDTVAAQVRGRLASDRLASDRFATDPPASDRPGLERPASSQPDADRPLHLALLLPSLAGGGVARVALNLAGSLLRQRHRVDLVLCDGAGAFRDQLPPDLRRVVLQRGNPLVARGLALAADPRGWRELALPVLLPLRGAPALAGLGALVDYLRRSRPDALIAAKTHTNLVAIWARRLAGVPTRLLVSQHSMLSEEVAGPEVRKWRWRHAARLVARSYPLADAIVAVSDAAADDLAESAGVPRRAIATVHNPVDVRRIAERMREPVAHPWFSAGGPPVVLGAGRLRESKDFPTLLRAFALVRRARPARLAILGEGPERDALVALARRLGVGEDLWMPGFVDNPFAYMARAGVFALSSRHEALGNVLVEALACGCPVVATDCPGGVGEILEGGAAGRLVAVGDPEALAGEILATLDRPGDRESRLRRADDFCPDRAAGRYLAALGLALSADAGAAPPEAGTPRPSGL